MSVTQTRVLMGSRGEGVAKRFMRDRGFVVLRDSFPRREPWPFVSNRGNYGEVRKAWELHDARRSVVDAQLRSVLGSADLLRLDAIYREGLKFDFVVYCPDERLSFTHLALVEVKSNKGVLRSTQKKMLVKARALTVPVFLVHVRFGVEGEVPDIELKRLV